MSKLSCDSLSISINGIEIVKSASLNVAPGECVGLIGPNGSGKTTFFNAISGFVPTQSGTVILGDKELTGLAPHQRSRLGLGRVFQASGVFRDLTVWENILVALENSANPVTTDSAHKLLEEVKLHGRENERAGSLSGGQLRLLEIARCLAAGSQAILLDEPTAGVSPKMRAELQGVIRATQQRGVTLVIIEHDMSFIFELCSRVVVMHEGRLILEGPPAVIRNDPQLAEIYFGK
jgi:branched-chain amino acid transport system ATP-binding protein